MNKKKIHLNEVKAKICFELTVPGICHRILYSVKKETLKVKMSPYSAEFKTFKHIGPFVWNFMMRDISVY